MNRHFLSASTILWSENSDTKLNSIMSHLTLPSFPSPQRGSSYSKNRILHICELIVHILFEIFIDFIQSLTDQSSLSIFNHSLNLIHSRESSFLFCSSPNPKDLTPNPLTARNHAGVVLKELLIHSVVILKEIEWNLSALLNFKSCFSLLYDWILAFHCLRLPFFACLACHMEWKSTKNAVIPLQSQVKCLLNRAVQS
jgi:hypothetical protein